MSGLTVSDLIAGLERFSAKYGALDVYAADVFELQQAGAEGRAVPENWTQIGPTAFSVTTEKGKFVAELKPEVGVLRLRRAGTTEPILGVIGGALVGVGVSAAFSKKPEAVIAGAILGMLVGATLSGPESSTAARQVFTMKFNPVERQWRAYSGALIPTMKQSLGLTPA